MPVETTSPLTPEAAPDPNRSAKQIERDINERRERLVATVDQITTRVKPANMANAAKQKATNLVVDQDSGSMRLNRVLPAVGVVAGLVTLVVARKLTHKPTRTERVQALGHDAADQASQLRDSLVELFTHASEAARQRAASAWEATADARGKVADVASSAAEGTRSAAETVRDQASTVAGASSDAASGTSKRMSQLWKKASKRLPWG